MADTHPLRTLEAFALVAVGGFAGANVRYLVGVFAPGMVGTLAVNVVGSVLLGVLLYSGLYAGTLSNESRAVLATGFLASMTTYSTFALESALATPTWLVLNVVASYGLGIGGVLLGRAVARRLVGVRAQ